MKRRRVIVALGVLTLAWLLISYFRVAEITPCKVAYERIHLGMSADAVRRLLPSEPVDGEGGDIVRGEWQGIVNGEAYIVALDDPLLSNDRFFKASLLRTAWKDYETEQTVDGKSFKDKQTGRVLYTQWEWFPSPDGMVIIFDADGKVVEKGYYVRRSISLWDRFERAADLWPF